MAAKVTVIYGTPGAGKSTKAIEMIKRCDGGCFKFGLGRWWMQFLLLRLGALRRHEEENVRNNLPFQTGKLKTLAKDLSECEYPNVLIDEWSTLFLVYPWIGVARVQSITKEVIGAIRSNSKIKTALFVTGSTFFLPFNLYKRWAAWNRALFAEADEIYRIEYGIPVTVKGAQHERV